MHTNWSMDEVFHHLRLKVDEGVIHWGLLTEFLRRYESDLVDRESEEIKDLEEEVRSLNSEIERLDCANDELEEHIKRLLGLFDTLSHHVTRMQEEIKAYEDQYNA